MVVGGNREDLVPEVGGQKDNRHEYVDDRNEMHDQPRTLLGTLMVPPSQVVAHPDRRHHAGGRRQGSRKWNRHGRQGRRGGNREFSEPSHQDGLGLRGKALEQKRSNVGNRLGHEFFGPFLGVVFYRPPFFRPGIDVVFLVDKHVKEVTHPLHGAGNRQGNGGTNESEAVPSRDGSPKDKDPVEKTIDKQKDNVVVHGRFGMPPGLEVEPHALVQSVRDGPKDVVLGVRSGNGTNVVGKAQRFENGFHKKEGRQTRQHGSRQPEHALLQPNPGHAWIVGPDGLADQSIEDLIEGQRRGDANVQDHVGQDGGRQIDLGAVDPVADVTNKGAVGRGHSHPAKETDGQGESQREHGPEFLRQAEWWHFGLFVGFAARGRNREARRGGWWFRAMLLILLGEQRLSQRVCCRCSSGVRFRSHGCWVECKRRCGLNKPMQCNTNCNAERAINIIITVLLLPPTQPIPSEKVRVLV